MSMDFSSIDCSMSSPIVTTEGPTPESIEGMDFASLIELADKVFDFISMFSTFPIVAVDGDCELTSKEVVFLSPKDSIPNKIDLEIEQDVPEIEQDVPEIEQDVPEIEQDVPEISADKANQGVPEIEQDVPEISADKANQGVTEIESTKTESELTTENPSLEKTNIQSVTKVDEVFKEVTTKTPPTPAASGNLLMRLWTYIQGCFF